MPGEPRSPHPPAADPDTVAAARRLVQRASRVTVLTGAGISTDSGIADFRGPQGLWTRDPTAERMADIAVYTADAAVRRQAWQNRLATFGRPRQPNPGHRALVSLERSGRLHCLVTQNVDGLHHDAGNHPDLIVEIHGTVREVACLRCGERRPSAEILDRVRAGEPDPPCRAEGPAGRCGGMLKTATISFGQSLVPADLARAERAAAQCDLLLAVGTTLAVYPVAGLVPLAASHGTPVVIVNAEPTELDHLARVVVRGGISEVLRDLVAP
jgi:NAD-dependent deacetylase